MIFIFIYLKGKVAQRKTHRNTEGEKETTGLGGREGGSRQRDREIFYPLVSFPQSLNYQDKATLKPRA